MADGNSMPFDPVDFYLTNLIGRCDQRFGVTALYNILLFAPMHAIVPDLPRAKIERVVSDEVGAVLSMASYHPNKEPYHNILRQTEIDGPGYIVVVNSAFTAGQWRQIYGKVT